MARTLWTGFVSFGLVTVPVGMYRVVEEQTPRFNQINQVTSNRVRYKKVDEITGEEVPSEDIIKGYDTGDGEYVLVSDEEIKEVAPGKSDTIEISDFVDLESIDPIHFRSAYYLAPRGKGADRAYSLLRQAMEETGKVAIATFVLRDKEHLVAIRPGSDVLILETMFFPEEIRDPRSELATLPADPNVDGDELGVAKQLIESLTIDWQPELYRNDYLERVDALLASKAGSKVKLVAADAKPTPNVIDLMSALQDSVARSGGAQSRSATAPAKAPVARIRKAKGTVDLDAMTRAQLLRLATDYAIAGRSKMPKDELVAALTEAGAGSPESRQTGTG